MTLTHADEWLAPGLSYATAAGGVQWSVSATNHVRYEVRVLSDVLDPANPALAEAGGDSRTDTRRRFVVVETQVHRLYGERIAAYFRARDIHHETLVIDAHEQVKSVESALAVVAGMDGFGLARRAEPVVAIGGGVLTDIVGLACGLYRRSTPYVRVPTTLVGMVDAAVGSKTGVNHNGRKNRLGLYHPAAVTLVDPAFLTTLDPRHLSNGLAEILKIALVLDHELFGLLEAHGGRLIDEHLQGDRGADSAVITAEVFRRSIQGILAELQPNLWEKRLTRVVDYGHSFSPAIEMSALPNLLHGEAVTIDMALTSIISSRRGWLDEDELARVFAVMRDLRLPSWHPDCTPELMTSALRETTRHRDGRQRLPLPVGIGAAHFVDDLSDDELAGALAELGKMGDAPRTGGRLTEMPVALRYPQSLSISHTGYSAER